MLVKNVWDDKKRQWIVTAFKDNSTPNKFNSRAPDITNNSSEMTPSANLLRANNIIPTVKQNLNLTHQAIKAPLSYDKWLEELKRKRKKLGFW